MYQTVGHQAVELYAEAMDLPLYRRTIEGSSVDTGREYSPNDADEVEDLFQLLQLVKVIHVKVLCKYKQAEDFQHQANPKYFRSCLRKHLASQQKSLRTSFVLQVFLLS